MTHPAPAATPRRTKGGPARLWLTSLAAVLLVGAASGGTWLWLRSASPTVTAGGDKAHHATGPSAPDSPSASPSARSHRAPPKADSVTAPSTTQENSVPDAQNSAPVPEAPPNPADPKNCRAWFTSKEMPNVQVRPCWRRDGSRIYMVGEWRATRGSETVDLYLWLKDATGKAVYPQSQARRYTGLQVSVPVPTVEQWKQEEVGIDLVQGAKYVVCLSVFPTGHPAPVITSTHVSGIQQDFTY
ncbi:hypothetical protein ACFWMU_13025 [Streptomyces sp. NPDC058357]|uniref:hypothetical protein n=1 Tax=unclassified Streptomyces TaxID=2593676 RepID=UPI00365A26AD